MTLALPERPAPAPVDTAPVQYMPAPAGVPDGTPRVFAAIADVMRDITPVSKSQVNQAQKYKFRGIDDLMSAMAGPMRAHGLFILPEMVGRTAARDGKMTSVVLTMRYHIYGPAGDCLIATVPGEASDFADKATNKAQSAALKYLLLQVFMIPVDGKSIDDGDRDHPEPPAEQQRPRRSQQAEQGAWEQQAPAAAPQRDFLAEAMQNAGRDEATSKEIRRAAHATGARGILAMLDDLDEAFLAPDVAAVRKLYTALREAGAPAEHLARIAHIGQSKPAAAPNPRPAETGPAPYSVSDAIGAAGAMVDDVTDAAGEASWQGEPGRQAAAEHATAQADMYTAAHAAGMESRDEADKAFASHYQCQPAAATVDQLREQAATLRQIAGAL